MLEDGSISPPKKPWKHHQQRAILQTEFQEDSVENLITWPEVKNVWEQFYHKLCPTNTPSFLLRDGLTDTGWQWHPRPELLVVTDVSLCGHLVSHSLAFEQLSAVRAEL